MCILCGQFCGIAVQLYLAPRSLALPFVVLPVLARYDLFQLARFPQPLSQRWPLQPFPELVSWLILFRLPPWLAEPRVLQLVAQLTRQLHSPQDSALLGSGVAVAASTVGVGCVAGGLDSETTEVEAASL